MIRSYLKALVRTGGKGAYGVGMEMFKLDAEEDLTLTEEELEAVEEEPEEVEPATTAIIRIYESIGLDFWTGDGITAKGFAKELDGLGDLRRLNIHINCLGGDCHTAQAIHSIIADYECQTKTSYIDGVAASAATVIACAADKVIARRNTNYMIHRPWAVCVGNTHAMKKAAEDLDKLTIPIVSVYHEQVKGKIGDEKILQLMDHETWMTADEALEYGFVDVVRGKMSEPVARVSKSTVQFGSQAMNVAKYHFSNIPIDNWPFQSKAEPQKKGNGNMPLLDKKKQLEGEAPPAITIEELRTNYPDLLDQIGREFMQKERQRLNSLDAMMAPGLEVLIASAKADGRSPGDIAVEANNIMRVQLTAAQNVNALHRDGQITVPAGHAPPNRQPQVSPQQKASSSLANAFARRNKRPVNNQLER
ncbi:MAG TPA: head maturation protease, ClpP-related [Bacteroidia bacterium]|jgi:ATP-dependent Clp protease protease subunit|nr:head maturation protease, ClpP-related [Bacteroidia bacterium]